MADTYSSLPNFLDKTTSSSPGTSLTYKFVLIAEPLVDKSLTYLPIGLRKNSLNIPGIGFQIIKTAGLLVAQFILELSNELGVTYNETC